MPNRGYALCPRHYKERRHQHYRRRHPAPQLALFSPPKVCRVCGEPKKANVTELLCDEHWKLDRRKQYRERKAAFPEKFKYTPEQLERKREHYRENRGYYATKNRAWIKQNPIRNRQRSRRYKANLRADGQTFTQQQWEALCKACGDVCLRCGSASKLTIDHVVPLTQGGKHRIWNVQPLCQSCNCRKRTWAIDYRPRAVRMLF